MPLACLVYIAKMKSKTDPTLMHQHKDMNTRIYARERITGILMVAGGYLFEIMEGEYATLEANLDRISGISIINDPDILIFTTLKKRQFHSWKMGILDPCINPSTDLTVFKILGEQAQSNAASTPVAALSMLKLFHEQFTNHDSHTGAA